MYQVTKHITLDAAHRLLGYDGLCSNLHGHTYKIELTVQAAELDAECMACDFHALMAVLQQVKDEWDHATLLDERDPLADILRERDQRVVIFAANPTAETMAHDVYVIACNALGDDAVVAVSVWETPTSVATFSPLMACDVEYPAGALDVDTEALEGRKAEDRG